MRELKLSLEETVTLAFVTVVKPTEYNLHILSSLRVTWLVMLLYFKLHLIKLRHQLLQKPIFTLEARKLAQLP